MAKQMKQQNKQGSKSSSQMAMSSRANSKEAAPVLTGKGQVIQGFDTTLRLPIGMDEKTCVQSIKALNQVLADTICLRDMYKKHHWQVSGVTFYQLHLLFDKHYEEQATLVDTIAERIQLLGGISVAMGAHVAEMTKIETPPLGREEVPMQISRLLRAHELIMLEVRDYAKKAEDSGDSGTNDLLVSNVLRTGELQTWFLAEHLVAEPLLASDKETN